MSDSPRPTLTTEALIQWCEEKGGRQFRAIAELLRLGEQSRQDAARLDWLASFEAEGYALISDDGGRWAMSTTGVQNVPEEEPADIWTSFHIGKDEWKPSPRDAIDAAVQDHVSRSQPSPPTQEAGT
jgi:hypothetical protein